MKGFLEWFKSSTKVKRWILLILVGIALVSFGFTKILTADKLAFMDCEGDDVWISTGLYSVKLNELKADNIESNLQEGDISLNGDQALWFSRIRKVNSDIYGRDDFGRTSRQRHVLDELFDKYKKMSYFEIYNTVDTVTKIVDIDKDLEGKIPVIAQMVSKFDVEKIENMRLPLDNAYTDTRVFIGSNSVLVLNVSNFMKKNIDELHMFLYGRKNIEDGKNKEDTDIESIDASSNSSVGNNS